MLSCRGWGQAVQASLSCTHPPGYQSKIILLSLLILNNFAPGGQAVQGVRLTGTPALISAQVEAEPGSTTLCFLSFKQSLNHDRREPEIPADSSS